MITIVRVSKGKGNFFKVELSNGDSWQISEDLMVRHRLLKGRELTEDELQEIKKNAGFDVGLQQAFNYISYQLRSEKEVRSFLKEKEIEGEDRNLIIMRLKELNLVNDRVYGESYVRTQMRTSDKGPSVVAQQLRQRGLNDQIIQEVLPLYTEEQQFDVAYHTAEKALRRFKGKSHKELQQKIKLHLMTKGFDQATIQSVFAELPLEKDQEAEASALEKEGQRLVRRHQRLPLAKRRMKIKQSLYQKGFDSTDIQTFLDEEVFDE